MKKIYNLTEGSILKKLIVVALPVLLTTISQMAYNLIDTFWIGRVDEIGMAETEAITAVGTVSYMIWFAFGFIIIAKMGTSVKISHAAGKKNNKAIDIYATNGILLELFLGILVSVAILIFKEEFLGIFKIQSQLVIDYALMYAPIVGGFIFIQFLTNGFSAINEGLGRTRTNLKILAVGFLLNIILDPIFILAFRMGIRGAAIATVISQAVTLSIFIIVYIKQNPNIKLFRIKDINIKAMADIIKVGVPIGIHSILFTSISVYIGRMVFTYGEDVVGAQRIGIQIEQLSWMIGGGFQTAITVFVGQNMGAKQYRRVKKGIAYISSILLPYSLLVCALLFFQAENIMKLFMDEPIPIQYGTAYLRIISISQIFMMLEAIGAGLYNGIGKSYVHSINGIIGNVIRIPLAIALSATLAESGIWWAMNVSSIYKGSIMVLASVFILTRLNKIKLKNINVEEEKEVAYG